MADIYVDAIGNDDDHTVDHQEIYGLDGNDAIDGKTNLFSRIYGGEGNDNLGYVGTAFASIYGEEGDDFVMGGANGDNLYGGEGNDSLRGDEFNAPGGDDYMDGGRGNDYLEMGVGADVAVGGPGADTFSFANGPLEGLVKQILDFKPADDVIRLSSLLLVNPFPDVSSPNTTGTEVLKGKTFFIGGKAKDANDRIGYNPKNGDLIYDSNGDDKGGKIVFAELDPHLKVTRADFLLVSE